MDEIARACRCWPASPAIFWRIWPDLPIAGDNHAPAGRNNRVESPWTKNDHQGCRPVCCKRLGLRCEKILGGPRAGGGARGSVSRNGVVCVLQKYPFGQPSSQAGPRLAKISKHACGRARSDLRAIKHLVQHVAQFVQVQPRRTQHRSSAPLSAFSAPHRWDCCCLERSTLSSFLGKVVGKPVGVGIAWRTRRGWRSWCNRPRCGLCPKGVFSSAAMSKRPIVEQLETWGSFEQGARLGASVWPIGQSGSDGRCHRHRDVARHQSRSRCGCSPWFTQIKSRHRSKLSARRAGIL